MNSALLRILAVFLAVGALLLAWSGYRISTKAATPQVQPAAPTYPQVTAARNIPAGKIIAVEDVKLVAAPQRDPHGYDSLHDVIGKLTIDPVPQDAPILSSNFPVLDAVAQNLRPGERGIAVKVNEVIGTGGFLIPGDHVDVLLYLRGDRETGDSSSAQVVLRDVRVLAYGDMVSNAPSALQEVLPQNDKNSNDKNKKIDSKSAKESRSAILAVPEKDVSRLMLADSSGALRLALRGAEPPQTVASTADPSQFVRLAEIARAPTQAAVTHTSIATFISPKPKAVVKKQQPVRVEQGTPITVHHGDRMEVVRVNN